MSKASCVVLALDKGGLVSALLSNWVEQMLGGSVAVYTDHTEIRTSPDKLARADVAIVLSEQLFIDLPSSLRRLRLNAAAIVLILAPGTHISIKHLNDLRVMGFFSTRTSLEQLHSGLKIVLQGKKYISHDFLDSFSEQKRSPNLTGLSRRELSLLTHVARGDENPAIAASLHISTKTVYSYKHRIYRKLGLKNDVKALLFAWSSGLVGRES